MVCSNSGKHSVLVGDLSCSEAWLNCGRRSLTNSCCRTEHLEVLDDLRYRRKVRRTLEYKTVTRNSIRQSDERTNTRPQHIIPRSLFCFSFSLFPYYFLTILPILLFCSYTQICVLNYLCTIFIINNKSLTCSPPGACKRDCAFLIHWQAILLPPSEWHLKISP